MAVLDLKSNYGSAVSQPGALSSTNLSTTGPGDPTDTGGQYLDPGIDYFGSGGGANPPAGPLTDLPPMAPIDTGNLGNTPPPTANIPDPNAPPATATGSQGFDWSSLLPSASTLTGLAPTLAAGGIGLAQAKAAQQQNDALAKQLAALGGPYTAAGQALLKQWQSGQLSPDKQNVVDTENKAGQTLIDSTAQLSQIAQQAYANYQSGTLPPADEQRLNDSVAAQKSQVSQQLASAGITDSTILAGQFAQIDNQAKITRQQLLDARFATGNQAYDQWLKGTTAGQALQVDAAKFAAKSFDDMMTQSLQLGSEGMQPIEASIQLEMQSNDALSAQVNQLMGNLASAYAYQTTGGKPGGTAGGLPSAAGNLLGQAGKALSSLGGGSGGQAGTAPPGGDVSGGVDPSTGIPYNVEAPGTGTSPPGVNPLDPNNTFTAPTDTGTTPVDTGNLGDTTNTDAGPSGPSTAGGEAATPGSGVDVGTLGSVAGTAGAGLGIAAGLQQGGAVGDTRAAIGATQLAGKAGLTSPGVNTAAGDLSNVLGIYTGIKQGGVAGDTGAAVNAAQLASKASLFGDASSTVGTVAGYAAIPLAAYNEIKTWKSGATGTDALGGAETGAAIGSAVLPGVGTLIGAVIGGVVGAVSSLFGSGKKGVAAGTWDQITKSNSLSKVPGRSFDQKSWAEAFKGMLDEGNNIFAGGGKDRHKDPDALAKPLEAEIKAGMKQLGPNATTDQVYNQIIVPWMQTSGSGLNWSVLKNEPQQQLMIKSAVDRVLAGEPIVRAEMSGAT